MTTDQDKAANNQPDQTAEVDASKAAEAAVEAAQQAIDEAQSGPQGTAEVTALQQKIDALTDQVEQFKDQAVRAQAEAQNVRRRAENDVEKAHKFALERFVKELLPILDSLEKGLEAAPSEEEGVAALRQGMELTQTMFISTLEKFNVVQIDPEGEPFDPQQHEAMTMIENPAVEPGTVINVMQKGYSLNGRLVRPAMVVVAKASEGSASVNERA